LQYQSITPTVFQVVAVAVAGVSVVFTTPAAKVARILELVVEAVVALVTELAHLAGQVVTLQPQALAAQEH
jgi:hypothetical protein